MKVKEAVEVLTYYDAHYYDTAHTDELAEIIDMLYEGKALKAENVELKVYKQMYNEIATMCKLPCYGLEKQVFKDIVKYLEQKYLKEAKQDETKDNRK